MAVEQLGDRHAGKNALSEAAVTWLWGFERVYSPDDGQHELNLSPPAPIQSRDYFAAQGTPTHPATESQGNPWR